MVRFAVGGTERKTIIGCTESITDAGRLRVVDQGGPALDIKRMSRKENGTDATGTCCEDCNADKRATVSELQQERLFAKRTQQPIALTGLDLKSHRVTDTVAMTVEGTGFRGQADIDARSGHAVNMKVSTPWMEQNGAVISKYEEITWYKRNDDSWYPDKSIEHMIKERDGRRSSVNGGVSSETILADFVCIQ